MKKHTKIYMNALGYNHTDFIPSEISGQKAVDVHHILGRGRGGEDRIENLMAVTREEHLEYGDVNKHIRLLLQTHLNFLNYNGVNYSQKWFNEKLTQYSD